MKVTGDERLVIARLGTKEVQARIDKMPNYEKYKVVARVGDTYGNADAPLTPDETEAFILLAKALHGRYPMGIRIDGLTLVTPVSTDELLAIVAQREIRDRQAAEAQDA